MALGRAMNIRRSLWKEEKSLTRVLIFILTLSIGGYMALIASIQIDLVEREIDGRKNHLLLAKILGKEQNEQWHFQTSLKEARELFKDLKESVQAYNDDNRIEL